MNTNLLIGSTTKVTNSLVSAQGKTRLEVQKMVLQSTDKLDAVLRSDLSILVRIFYAAYCINAVRDYGLSKEVKEIITHYPDIGSDAVSRLSSIMETDVESFAKQIASGYFGCTQAERTYMREIISYIVVKKPKLMRIFDKCLTASEIKNYVAIH